MLLMWVTNPKLEVSMKIINAWGFRYRTKFLEWIKMNNGKAVVNLGKYSTNCTGSLLLASKGDIIHFLKEAIIK